MPSRWFSIPSIDDGTAPDLGAVAWGGNRLANSGRFVVRVWADASRLDGIEARPGVVALPTEQAVQALNSQANCTIDSNSRFLKSE